MRDRVKQVLGLAPTVITFSHHVAKDVAIFGPPKQVHVHVIPSAPVSVADQIPFLEAGKPSGDRHTRRHAGDLLRAISISKGLKYLYEFPFEDVSYFVVSTQDRVSKNIGLAAEAAEQLVRSGQLDIKMITTAPINWGDTWTRLPSLVEQYQLQHDVLSMHDLPRPAHASFYHCAQLAVHPSFFEGGQGVFPFYEALSVGCPCIMADGPHTAEQAAIEPRLSKYLFNPFNKADLARLILHVVKNRDEVVEDQLSILKRMKQRGWSEVAREYAKAAIARSRNDI
jgi:glycosyltransferase involved in cell wall biosynthesis